MMGEHARLLFRSHKNFKQMPNEHYCSDGSYNNSGNLHISPPLIWALCVMQNHIAAC